MAHRNVVRLPHRWRAVAAITAIDAGRNPDSVSTLTASATVAPVVRMSSTTMMLRPPRPATDLILNAPDIFSERSWAESPDWSATRRAWTSGEPTVQSIPMDRTALAAARLRSPMVSCPLRIRVTRVEGMGTNTTGLSAGAAKHTDEARKWPRTRTRPNWPSSLNCARTALSGPSWMPEAIGSINDGWHRICGVGRGHATRGCGVSMPAHEAHSVIAGRPHPAQEAPMMRSAAATLNGSTVSDCPVARTHSQ